MNINNYRNKNRSIIKADSQKREDLYENNLRKLRENNLVMSNSQEN